MNIILYFIFFFYAGDHFTGEVTYQYLGYDNWLESSEFVFGDDFYFEVRKGEALEKMSYLNREFLIDITRRKIYHIYDWGVEYGKIDNSITKFHNVIVEDTVEYLGHKCKVITFKMNSEISELLDYKYYYPLDLKLSKDFLVVPEFFGNRNDFFKPFNEPFVPIYIEIFDSKSKKLWIIKATKISNRIVNREEYFNYVNSKE